jgi:hypothetical protein
MTATSPEEPWIALGIRGRATRIGAVYNSPSRHLVVQCTSPGADSRCIRSLYYRDVVGGATYTVVAGSGQDVDHTYPVSSPVLPEVFFLVWRAGRAGDNWGFNWESIAKLSLPSGEVTVVRSSLELPSGYTDAWITELLAVSPAGDQVTAIAGLQRPPRDSGRSVEYCIAVVSLSSGRVDRIATLPTAYM